MQRVLANAVAAGVLAGAVLAAGVGLAPAATASNCANGFVRNPYNAQCLAPVVTPVISGVPCVPSNLGLCSSFVQNRRPPLVPGAVGS